MLRTLASLALAALILGCVTGCGSSSAGLKVGDCVSYQAGTGASGNNDLQTVVVDCAQPHDGEVFNVFTLPGATFPGYLTIGDAQQDECSSAFTKYVGVEWAQSEYTIEYSGPTEQTWATGNHQIVCTLTDPTGVELIGSAKGTAQ